MKRDSNMATSGPSTTAPRAGARYAARVVLCFTFAAASFIGGTVYADRRLERISKLTRDVSDNAMPSLVHIGTMRRELAEVHLMLKLAAEGRDEGASAVGRHLDGLADARRGYESMPQFPGEPEVWARGGPMIDDVRELGQGVMADVRGGALVGAQLRVAQEVSAAVARADDALVELRTINLEQGNIAAREAASALRRTRLIAVILDVTCVVFTAALAWLAIRSMRERVALEAHRADELDAFAVRVAHDLRGPLAPPLLALEQLARDLDPESPHKRIADAGARSLRRAELLVRDLLLFARGAAPDRDAHASVAAAVADVVQTLEDEASAARVRIDVADLPSREVACAPGVLSSIVQNLVANAIKFMPPDTEPRVVSLRGSGSAEHVRVEVADTGPGIPEDARSRIFEPYVRVDASRPGLGVGLATVKRLVEAHGGKVGVDSRVGVGSVFWFELPAFQA